MWDYKIFQFYGFPRMEFHLSYTFIKSSTSWYWVWSKCSSILQIRDAIFLFLIVAHSRRNKSILVIKVIGVSIQFMIFCKVSWVIPWIWSFIAVKYLSIYSNFSFGGAAWSIGSNSGISRKPSKVTEENHLFFHITCPSLMMDSTTS